MRIVPSNRMAGAESEDLDVTMLVWPAGKQIERHVNSEVDVAMVFVEGSAVLTIDDEELHAEAGQVVLIEKGKPRSLTAGSEGVRYVTVHKRRRKLMPLSVGVDS